MNEWTYDDVLDAVRERLNVPSPHWEDYGPGSPWADQAVIRQPGPSEDDAIIRAAEPWDIQPFVRRAEPGETGDILRRAEPQDNPAGGVIGSLARLLDLEPLMEWAHGYDMKPTWLQDLIPGVVGNLPGPELTAKLMLPAALGAVKWGERIIPNMFVYRGMRNPTSELPWLENLIRYAKHIIHPEEQSASLVTPKFLGAAAPEGVLFHGDVSQMPAMGFADLFSEYVPRMSEMWGRGKTLDVRAIRKTDKGVRVRERVESILAEKEKKALADVLGWPLEHRLVGADERPAVGEPVSGWALNKLGLERKRPGEYRPTVHFDDEDIQKLTPEQFSIFNDIMSKAEKDWPERLAGYLAPVPEDIIRFPDDLSGQAHRAMAYVKGYGGLPEGPFSVWPEGNRLSKYERARQLLEQKAPAPYDLYPYELARVHRQRFAVDPSAVSPEEFLAKQADLFWKGRGEGPTGFYNEIAHRIGPDVRERLAGVRVDPLDPDPHLLRFAEKYDLPLYAWPYSLKRPENIPPEVTQWVRRSPFIDLMHSPEPLGGSWASVRETGHSPLPEYFKIRDYLTSTEYPPGYDYLYYGRPFAHE